MMPPLESQSENPGSADQIWTDACLSIRLAAGMVQDQNAPMPTFCVSAKAGPVLDRWLELLASAFSGRPFSRLQSGNGIAALQGGLDLSATLAAGKRVYKPGLLERCNGGILVVPISGIPTPDVAACINASLDGKIPGTDRANTSFFSDGIGIVVIDESEEDEDVVPAGLRDRLRFHVDLNHVGVGNTVSSLELAETGPIKPALCDTEVLKDICNLSLGFGLTSLRPAHHALQVAQFHAGFMGHKIVEEVDVIAAIRLTMLNRALTVPTDQEPETDDMPSEAPDEGEKEPDTQTENNADMPNELDVSAVLATLPPDLLAALKSSSGTRSRRQAAGRNGGGKLSYRRGRPIASTRGELSGNRKLDLVSTLRAAAPWQKARREAAKNNNRIQVRKRDFHVRRFLKPSETSIIFVVDASGSTAINRLGEAKGAVEILLGESYSRRDHVALVSLRGQAAELSLPPTRSLTRARKTLAGMKGGGGTPMAHGLQVAQRVVADEIRRGRSPNLILLTDGSANITLEGTANRAKAMDDAMEMASHVAMLDCGILVIDVSRSVNGRARKVADSLRAQYIPMPFASAKNISDVVRVSQN